MMKQMRTGKGLPPGMGMPAGMPAPVQKVSQQPAKKKSKSGNPAKRALEEKG